MWTISIDRIVAIPAFVFIFFGSLMLSINIAKLIFPHFRSVHSLDLFDKADYAALKKKLGWAFKRFSYTYIFLWLVIFIGGGYCYLHYTSLYEQEQMEQFSQVKKVMIRDVYFLKSVGRQVEFQFSYNNIIYTNRLSSDDLQVGDSVQIFFSANNPEIVSWDIK